MGLQDALRKAAGLLIELPPENDEASGGTGTAAADLTAPEEIDVDALLAEKGLGPRARGDASASTRSVAPAPTTGTAASKPGDASRAGGGATPRPGEAKAGEIKPGETKTVEQLVRDAKGPNLEDIKVDATVGPPAGGNIDCAAIYTAAKLPASPFTAEQMLEMLASLPPELPLETKRQTVKVTLGALGKSMGATPETIVADASRKMAALAAYAQHLSKRTDEFVSGGEKEIAALQAQIEEKRKSIANARQELERATQMCDRESDKLDDVLEFFSLDLPPSKYAASSARGSAPSQPGAASPVGGAQPASMGSPPVKPSQNPI